MTSRRLSLQRLFFHREHIPAHLPGDSCDCADCRGRLKVYATKYREINGASWMIRYLHCNTCGNRPEDNKNLIPPEFFSHERTTP